MTTNTQEIKIAAILTILKMANSEQPLRNIVSQLPTAKYGAVNFDGKTLLTSKASNASRHVASLRPYPVQLAQLIFSNGWLQSSNVELRMNFGEAELEQIRDELQTERDALAAQVESGEGIYTAHLGEGEAKVSVKVTPSVFLTEFDKHHHVVNGNVPLASKNAMIAVAGNQRLNATLLANAATAQCPSKERVLKVQGLKHDLLVALTAEYTELDSEQLLILAYAVHDQLNVDENNSKDAGTVALRGIDHFKTAAILYREMGTLEGLQNRLIKDKGVKKGAAQVAAAVIEAGIEYGIEFDGAFGKSLIDHILEDSWREGDSVKVMYTGINAQVLRDNLRGNDTKKIVKADFQTILAYLTTKTGVAKKTETGTETANRLISGQALVISQLGKALQAQNYAIANKIMAMPELNTPEIKAALKLLLETPAA